MIQLDCSKKVCRMYSPMFDFSVGINMVDSDARIQLDDCSSGRDRRDGRDRMDGTGGREGGRRTAYSVDVVLPNPTPIKRESLLCGTAELFSTTRHCPLVETPV